MNAIPSAPKSEVQGMNILTSETAVRFGCFAGVLVLMALGEMIAPRRRLTAKKPVRWFSNLALVGLNAIMLRILVPLGASGVAILLQERGWGILNVIVLPTWAAVLLSVIVLDFVIYLQHVLFHAVPVLWRLHMVHHADLDFDVTTGLRFHTIEILLSMLIKLAAIAVLGPPPVAVLMFEVLLNATAMFNHSNVRLPLWLDRVLRRIVVTPDMHRVHHSVIARETNSNFGFNLPWWDLLLGTYRSQPADGHEGMTIGLSQLRNKRVTYLHWMLALPFIGEPGEYPVNRERRQNDEILGDRERRALGERTELQRTAPGQFAGKM
jgi:sterol desaturase/sphingolipid hydroxylase (fatty acid hydroxylase superfamily)